MHCTQHVLHIIVRRCAIYHPEPQDLHKVSRFGILWMPHYITTAIESQSTYSIATFHPCAVLGQDRYEITCTYPVSLGLLSAGAHTQHGHLLPYICPIAVPPPFRLNSSVPYDHRAPRAVTDVLWVACGLGNTEWDALTQTTITL
jgi:hypothetical protein